MQYFLDLYYSVQDLIFRLIYSLLKTDESKKLNNMGENTLGIYRYCDVLNCINSTYKYA